MSFRREKIDLQKKLQTIPHKPGVYVMRDRLNRVIYVGKARDLRRRLSHYFTPARSKLAERKTKALIESIWDFDHHLVKNDSESLILEMRLIKEYRPKYNVSFKDDKRYLMVRIQLSDEIPRFSFTRLKKEDGAKYFGPFAHSSALKTTLNWLNREFGLRVCRPLRPREEDYKHCSNDIIKNCSAPCIGRISPEAYREKAQEACDFLSGKSKALLGKLEEDMKKAAARLDFERAAELRDMLDAFQKTLTPTRTFERNAFRRVASTINPEADLHELKEWLSLDSIPQVMECFDIANIGTAHCVASMVRFKNGVPDNSGYRRYRIRIVSGQNDFASMSEVVRRRYSRILQVGQSFAESLQTLEDSQENPLDLMRRLEALPDSREFPQSKRTATPVRLPDLVIVDGGKGQLSAAVKELQRLGLHDLPIIGLAKENEEIYLPERSAPILIPHDQGALKLLQRIRDEAHRWANGYHQLLLRKRVSESLLDDCPGMTSGKKQKLLKNFGSLNRLKKASVSEIEKVDGISLKMATQIHTFLSEPS